MGDDAVALHVAEKLRGSLEAEGIEVIIGETDFQYCLNKIEKEDYIIILDAAWLGKEPGTVTLQDLKTICRLKGRQSLFSQHGYSLISVLESCFTEVNGCVICIEGCKFDFSLTLSCELQEQFGDICRKVEELCRGYNGIRYNT